MINQIIKPKRRLSSKDDSLSTEIIRLSAEGRSPEADNLMIEVDNESSAEDHRLMRFDFLVYQNKSW